MDHLLFLPLQAIEYAADEVEAAEHLREVMSKTSVGVLPLEAVEMITKAIDRAAAFHNLSGDVSCALLSPLTTLNCVYASFSRSSLRGAWSASPRRLRTPRASAIAACSGPRQSRCWLRR